MGPRRLASRVCHAAVVPGGVVPTTPTYGEAARHYLEAKTVFFGAFCVSAVHQRSRVGASKGVCFIGIFSVGQVDSDD